MSPVQIVKDLFGPSAWRFDCSRMYRSRLHRMRPLASRMVRQYRPDRRRVGGSPLRTRVSVESAVPEQPEMTTTGWATAQLA